MSKSDFEKLKREQREWITSGRDEAAKKLMKEGNYSKTEAYAEATRQRVREIYGQIPLASVKANDFIGSYESNNGVNLDIWWKDNSKQILCAGFHIPRISTIELQGCPHEISLKQNLIMMKTVRTT